MPSTNADTSTGELDLGDPAFWRRSLQERMDDFAAMR